ncbi:MAG: 30S ribosomal protein S16 [bacterium]
MSVKIRLQRRGTTNTAFYKIVVTDSRMRRDGRYIEELGFYDPLKTPALVKVDREAAFRWLKNGAQPSDTVERIFSKVGILADWQKVRRGEAVETVGAAESHIFTHKEAARPSKKAKAKTGKDAKETKEAPATAATAEAEAPAAE